MKTFLLYLFVSLGFVLAPLSTASVPPTELAIESIHGRKVQVHVPAGIDRVTLQQLVVPKSAKRGGKNKHWRTVATKYARGVEGAIEFRLPKLVPKRFLHVYGDKAETADDILLSGITHFAADPLTGTTTTSGGFKSSGGLLGTAAGENAFTSGDSTPSGSADPREVVEADIWKVQGDRLYYYNQLRGLQAFDLSKPEDPVLLGTLRMPASGEDLYLLGDSHAVLLKQAFSWGGWYGGGYPIYALDSSANLRLAASATAADSTSLLSVGASLRPFKSDTGSSEIIVADVRAGAPKLVASVSFEGSLAESRLVGSVLYVASNVSHAATDTTAEEYGLQISSFDLSDPANPVQRASIFLGGWANAVTATEKFFLVAKYADDGSWNSNVIDLIDISAPDGAMTRSGQVKVAGTIDNKFNLNIEGTVLTAVAQVWDDGTGEDDEVAVNASTSLTRLQTFSIANPSAPTALGSIDLAPGETVRATRFALGRAYVVTFLQIDPLFVVDLTNPAKPTVAGHVKAPGFSTYIEPLGDRLVTIGLVDWQPAVSLFDVSDAAAPKLLSQIKLGQENGWADSEAVWNEKAFKVLPDDNLILLPVSGSGENDDWFSKVQLIDLLPDRLVKRGAIKHGFSPRRATLVKQCIVAISPTRLVTVNADNRDQPIVKADLQIAWRVDRLFASGKFLVQIGGSADWSNDSAPTLSVSPQTDPDATISLIDLPNLPVRGATVQDDVLYVAQAQPVYYESDDDVDGGKQNLTVSAFDLSQLPAISLLGSASTKTNLGYGDLSAHWPSPGVLVWAGDGSWRAWWGSGGIEPLNSLDTTTTAAAGSKIAVSSGIVANLWFYANPVRLVAFDFSDPKAPVFLSEAAVGEDQPWDLSEPFAANGMLFFSYRFFGDVNPYFSDSKLATTSTSASDSGDTAPAERANRHFLVRVDYAEPQLPVVDDTGINLPGKLRGLAKDGTLLLTTGQAYDLSSGDPIPGESALHVSALDGTSAHLLDSLPLHSATDPVVISGDRIYTLDPQPAYIWRLKDDGGDVELTTPTGVASTDLMPIRWWWGSWVANDKTSTLAAWKLEDAGAFSKLGEVSAEHDTALYEYEGLIVTQDGSRTLHLFDGTGTAVPELLGSFTFDGWVYPDLAHADGGISLGLWVPLGEYGVEAVTAVDDQ